MVALRLVSDRICPLRKTGPDHIERPPIQDATGVVVAQQEVLRATCSGEVLLDAFGECIGIAVVASLPSSR